MLKLASFSSFKVCLFAVICCVHPIRNLKKTNPSLFTNTIAGRGRVRSPGPLQHNRWLLLGLNLLLFGSRVFSSSTGPPCHPVQIVLCWRPFSKADGTQARISQACTLESKLVDLLEQFVLIVSCSFPLYLAVINQAMPWQIYLESLLSKQDCHKLQVTHQLKAYKREETEITEPDFHSNHAAKKTIPYFPFKSPFFCVIFILTKQRFEIIVMPESL